jgi:hypothetical protein
MQMPDVPQELIDRLADNAGANPALAKLTQIGNRSLQGFQVFDKSAGLVGAPKNTGAMMPEGSEVVGAHIDQQTGIVYIWALAWGGRKPAWYPVDLVQAGEDALSHTKEKDKIGGIIFPTAQGLFALFVFKGEGWPTDGD